MKMQYLTKHRAKITTNDKCPYMFWCKTLITAAVNALYSASESYTVFSQGANTSGVDSRWVSMETRGFVWVVTCRLIGLVLPGNVVY